LIEYSDCRIGTLFHTASGLWQCTAVGTRTIVAIHLEGVDVDGTAGKRTLAKNEAKAAGLFHDPPYIVGELMLADDDVEGC